MKCWKFSPGNGACYWNYCRGDNPFKKPLLAIGWSRVGNLDRYEELAELSVAFKRKGWHFGLWNTGDTQLWDFKNIKKDDIIVAYGKGLILSIGKSSGKYFFDEKNAIDKDWDIWYSHRHWVKWLPKTRKDVSQDDVLYGNPPAYLGTLNKNLTFYEITEEYTINYINKIISCSRAY